jgi:ribonuclease HI
MATIKKFECATDGGCNPNPGLGAYAFIIDGVIEVADIDKDSTSSRSEILGLYKLLEYLEAHYKNYRATIYVDSEYVMKSTTAWMFQWRINGWKLRDKSPVKHRDLWENIYKMYNPKKHVIEKVLGHSGHALNERVDTLTWEVRKQKCSIMNRLSE